jgi:hypothetical protein
MSLLTQGGYAKHRKQLGLSGGSQPGVSKAIKTKRITCNADGMIDPVQADKDWEENSNRRQRRDVKSNSLASAEQIQITEGKTGGTFLEAQCAHEWLKVRKEEMELKRKRGELWDAGQTQSAMDDLVSVTRSHLLLIPAKLSHKVAPITDPAECQAIIDREIKEALKSLSEKKLHAA